MSHPADIDLRPVSPPVESRPGLLRALGPGMAVAMVVGNVIGSGIFYKPGEIAAKAGDFSLIITAWIVGGLVCLLGGLCFAELGAMLPRAGGLYVYLREAYGRPMAFLFGWTEFLFGKPSSNAALAVAFTGAFAAAFGWRPHIAIVVLLAGGLIVLMAWVNILGVIWGGRVQAGTTLIKAGFLGLMAVLPFALAGFGTQPAFHAGNYESTLSAGPEEVTLATQFAAAMLAVMWAYNGWHGITPVAEEIRDPERNIPRALFVGIAILIALYVAANFAYHGVLSMDELAADRNAAAQNMVRQALLPVGEGWSRFGMAAISAVIMCSTFGALNSNIMNAPRIAFAMGRDDVFFRALRRVHVNYRTPAVAIAVQAALAALLMLAVASHVASQGKADTEALNGTFEILTNLVVFSASLFYFMAVLAVIVLRRRRPDWRRPYRTLGYPLVPLAYLVFYTWFLYYVYVGRPLEANVGLVLVAFGLPAYFAWQAWSRRHPEDVSDGE